MLKNTLVSFEDTSVAFSSRSDKELKKMHFLFSAMSKEFLTKIGTFFIKTALKIKLPVKNTIKKLLFNQFCGGENLAECSGSINLLANYNIHTILDYAVEGENNEKSFNETVEKLLETIKLDQDSDNISFSVFKVTGIAPFELLEKVQKGESLSRQENEKFERVRKRIDLLCQTAWDCNVRLMIDAEESWIQGTIDALAYDVMRKYNREHAVIFNTYQMYRTEMPHNLTKALNMAKDEGFFLGAKIVRGAYMEKERARAREMNYPSPVFPTKEDTDEAFDNALLFCIENRKKISMCCGSHNEKSNYYLMELMDKYHIPANDPNVWFSQLYGMSDNISYNLAAAGYNVAKYVPYGPLEAVMPYLFRRAEENKSVTGDGSRELEMIRKEMKRRGLS